jgi:hypothetical protein
MNSLFQIIARQLAAQTGAQLVRSIALAMAGTAAGTQLTCARCQRRATRACPDCDAPLCGRCNCPQRKEHARVRARRAQATRSGAQPARYPIARPVAIPTVRLVQPPHDDTTCPWCQFDGPNANPPTGKGN